MTENLQAVGLEYCFCDSLPFSRVSIFFYILESLCLYDHDPTVQNEWNPLRLFHRVLEPAALRSRHSLLRSRLPTRLSQKMEARWCQVAVTISYSALLCPGEALSTLLLASLVTSRFLAQDLVGPLETQNPKMKGDPAESQAKLKDAEGDDDNDDDDDDNDGDGGFGEGEDVSSEDDGGNFGKNTNGNKSNSKKGPGGGAGGTEENGEGEDDDEEEDGEDQDDEDDDEDDDDEDDGDEEEDEEEVEEVENEDEEEEDEDEEALQPPKKRKK